MAAQTNGTQTPEVAAVHVAAGRRKVVEDQVATYQVAPAEPATATDPIRDILRAKGYLADENRPRPAPRGETESIADYMVRVRDWMMEGRVFSDDSAELLRQLREERTAELDRAAGIETADH